MRYTKKEKQLAILCWDDRHDGRHGYIARAKGWLTLEPMGDELDDYILAVYTNKIDDLGYPFGDVFNFDYIDGDTIEKWRKNTNEQL